MPEYARARAGGRPTRRVNRRGRLKWLRAVLSSRNRFLLFDSTKSLFLAHCIIAMKAQISCTLAKFQSYLTLDFGITEDVGYTQFSL